MANDHDGLAAKEFIQAPSMMFNRATKRKLSWDLQYLYNCAFTQVRKSNHSLAKLYTSILYHDLYAKVRTWGLTAKELADLRTRFVALGNIFAQKQKTPPMDLSPIYVCIHTHLSSTFCVSMAVPLLWWGIYVSICLYLPSLCT